MAIKFSVTVWLIPDARGGPFIFQDTFEQAIADAQQLGFDAIELFPPEPGFMSADVLNRELSSRGLCVSAVGSGVGWVRHKLSLTHGDAEHRRRAIDYVKSVIDWAAQAHAPVIIGSMQGRWGEGVTRDQALGYLGEALSELGNHAARQSQPLLYEPLNRYETNLLNTLDDAAAMIRSLKSSNVRILADLFHMHIEERNLAESIVRCAPYVGHIHIADSNRHAPGFGHMNYGPIVEAIKSIGFDGFVAAEAFPVPDPMTAARQTITHCRRMFDRKS